MKRAIIALACALALVHGCGAEREHPEPEATLQPASEPARAWLSELKRAHALADRATTPEAQREAAQVLATLARAQPPVAFEASAAEPARQDLFGRAADLLAQAGEPRRALEWLDEGVTLRTPGPFFTQLVLQTAEVKAALGDPAGAEAARQVAARLLQ